MNSKTLSRLEKELSKTVSGIEKATEARDGFALDIKSKTELKKKYESTLAMLTQLNSKDAHTMIVNLNKEIEKLDKAISQLTEKKNEENRICRNREDYKKKLEKFISVEKDLIQKEEDLQKNFDSAKEAFESKEKKKNEKTETSDEQVQIIQEDISEIFE